MLVRHQNREETNRSKRLGYKLENFIMWDINLILVFGWFGMELVISTSKFVACKRKKTSNVGLMAKEKNDNVWLRTSKELSWR